MKREQLPCAQPPVDLHTGLKGRCGYCRPCWRTFLRVFRALPIAHLPGMRKPDGRRFALGQMGEWTKKDQARFDLARARVA